MTALNSSRGNDPDLPPSRLDDLHDSITLALDALGHRPSERNLAEARSYLRTGLRLMGVR